MSESLFKIKLFFKAFQWAFTSLNSNKNVNLNKSYIKHSIPILYSNPLYFTVKPNLNKFFCDKLIKALKRILYTLEPINQSSFHSSIKKKTFLQGHQTKHKKKTKWNEKSEKWKTKRETYLMWSSTLKHLRLRLWSHDITVLCNMVIGSFISWFSCRYNFRFFFLLFFFNMMIDVWNNFL